MSGRKHPWTDREIGLPVAVTATWRQLVEWLGEPPERYGPPQDGDHRDPRRYVVTPLKDGWGWYLPSPLFVSVAGVEGSIVPGDPWPVSLASLLVYPPRDGWVRVGCSALTEDEAAGVLAARDRTVRASRERRGTVSLTLRPVSLMTGRVYGLRLDVCADGSICTVGMASSQSVSASLEQSSGAFSLLRRTIKNKRQNGEL